jgi:hypothetical protein
MHIFIADLHEDGTGIGKEIAGNGETVAEIGECSYEHYCQALKLPRRVQPSGLRSDSGTTFVPPNHWSVAAFRPGIYCSASCKLAEIERD